MNADPSQAASAINRLLHNLTDAWNRNDAVAWAQAFAEEATFVNVRGDSVQGRAAIEAIHAFIFNGPYKQSHLETTVESVTWPAPTVAVVQATTEVTGYKGLPPGLAPTEPGKLRTRMTFILVRQSEAWTIFAAQNTVVASQPMPVTMPMPVPKA